MQLKSSCINIKSLAGVGLAFIKSEYIMLQFKDLNGLHSCEIIKNTENTCEVLVSFWTDFGIVAANKVLSVKRHKDVLFLNGTCIL